MVYALYWLYSDSIDFQDGVNDLNVGTNESIFFSLVWRKTPKNAWIVIECWLKCKNCQWIWFTCKWWFFLSNDCIFTQLSAP